jgi:hypothetical protein
MMPPLEMYLLNAHQITYFTLHAAPLSFVSGHISQSCYRLEPRLSNSRHLGIQ